MKDRHIRVTLLRPGDDKGTAKQQFLDEELTVEGIHKVGMLLPKMAQLGITRIYNSPSKHCIQTAKIINERIESEMVTDDRIKSRNMGKAEGLSFREISEKFSDILNASFTIDFRFPDGESNGDAFERSGLFLRETLQKLAAGVKESILIIASPLILNYLMYNLQNLGFREGMYYPFEFGQFAVLESQEKYFQLIEFTKATNNQSKY